MSMAKMDFEKVDRTRLCIDCQGDIKKGEYCLTFRYGAGMNSVVRQICNKCLITKMAKVGVGMRRGNE